MGKRAAIPLGGALAVIAVWGCAVAPPPWPTPAPTLSPAATQGRPTQAPREEVTLEGVQVLTDTVVVTFTVRAAYLFDTPVLRDGAGNEAGPLPESLDAAHFALLDAVTHGQATASLRFPRPAGELPLRQAQGNAWTLVFNPQHDPSDHVAPRVEVRIGAGR